MVGSCQHSHVFKFSLLFLYTVAHLSEHWKVLQKLRGSSEVSSLHSLCKSLCISGQSRHLVFWFPEVSFSHMVILFAGLGGKGPVQSSPLSSRAIS